MSKRLALWSSTIILLLYLFVVFNSCNSSKVITQDTSLMISMGLDITKYPSRNCGLPRKSNHLHTSSSIKLKATIQLLNVSLFAYSLVLLAGDVNPNPGPAINSQDQLSFSDNGFPTKRGLKISHLNVRSLIHKMDSLRLLLKDNPFDILTISETWLNNNISNPELSIQGYSSVRNDRTDKKGGGCMIYVRDGIPYRTRSDLHDDNTESCVIEVNRPKCKKMLIWSIYRAPDQPLHNFIDSLNSKLTLLPQEAEIILLGDFNVDALAKRKAPGYSLKQKITLFANTHNLHQLIDTPTRITEQSSTAIDLLFVSNKYRIVSSGVIPVHISDHSLIYCVVKSGVPKCPGKTIEYRSYKHYSKEAFLADLRNVNWDVVDEIPDIDTSVNVWNKLFTDVAEHHAPVKKTRIKGCHVPWMTSELKSSMQERDRCLRRAVKSNSSTAWSKYKSLKAHVNKQVKKSKTEYYRNIIKNSKNDPNTLWKHLNEITSRKPNSNISCIEVNGTPHTEPKRIAEVLNDHFSSIGSILVNKFSSITSVPNEKPQSEVRFAFKDVDECYVASQLSKLKANKAIGLDNISARLLKDSASIISTSLTKIYNRSLATSVFPAVWKLGKVTALFKSGNRCDANNYRPITILPSVSKILEKAAHHQIYNYLLQENILTPNQFGFRPKLSTGIALTHFTDTILENMDKGSITGAVFLDLSKAFDTVSHDLLIEKLGIIGFSQSTIEWFNSYLSNRFQVTSVGRELSSNKPVLVGVPQGSILGPLLFLIYVNDLPSTVQNCNISLYADDTVLFCSAKTAFHLEEQLNSDLLTLSKWFATNRLTLNTSKCKFMVFGGNAKLMKLKDINLVINNNPLNRVEYFKYLGVSLSRSLSWSNHIEILSKKIYQRLGVIGRVKHLLSLESRLTLVNSLVMPLFDYADFVWGDKNNSVLMDHLQVLHNKAARIILDLHPLSSATESLRSLHWQPLSVRRLFHRCLIMHKCLNNDVDFDFNFKYIADIHNYNTRNKHNLHLQRVNRNWGKQSFTYHGAQDWNSLPEELRNTNLFLLFKLKLKKHLKL